MRIFLTGGTGFLGGALAARLAAERHEVIALARKTSDASALSRNGVRIAVGDVVDRASLREPMAHVDTVFHVAAWYELGVRDLERMRRINVEGTRNVLEVAAEAGARSIVHTSSVAALGSTGGKLVDEGHRHPGDFASAYERTKFESHEVARELAREGAPVRIALPGTIFGPGDKSLVATAVQAHLRGRIRFRAFSDLALSMVLVDDCAAGLQLAAFRGAMGGEYIFADRVLRVGEWLEKMADITGIEPPRRQLPRGLIRAAAAAFPLFAPLFKMAPDTLKDGLAMAEGRSWMFSSERARRELGWSPTDFELALARTLVAFDPEGGRRFRPRTEQGRAALETVLGALA
ncbi:MAG: NAD-dependent epimerase/dehydratase family protein [Myxococcales bacterium]|nr:NAD-dependent epimerase/dehydratase family protein [Myxococcales bacterium]